MSEQAIKHLNIGYVFGKVIEEPKKGESTGGEPYLSFKVSCSGAKCGQVTAYCRIWKAERCIQFLADYRKNPDAVYSFKGFYGQYKNPQNEFLSNYTLFQWEARDKVDPRAVFKLKGVVDQATGMTDGGQRMLFKVKREGQPEELFELYTPGELLLDRVVPGQVVDVKGYVRQQELEGEFGGASGPIRAYVHEMKVL